MSSSSGSSSGNRAIRVDWLDLQSKVLKRWKKRWTILDDEKLSFYEPTNVQQQQQQQQSRSENIGQSYGPLDCSILFSDIVAVTGPESDEFILSLQLRSLPLIPVKIKCFTRERAKDWKADIQYRSSKKEK